VPFVWPPSAVISVRVFSAVLVGHFNWVLLKHRSVITIISSPLTILLEVL
jgi:hypothetical protein